MPDKDYTKIESARKSGLALTGKDFKSSSSKTALSGLLKSDRTKNMSAADLAAEEQKHRLGFKRGGMVKHTGTAKLHRGERVLTAKQSKRMSH